MILVGERRVLAVTLVADNSPFAALGPLTAANAGVLEHIATDLGLGPTGGFEVLAELWWQNDGVVPGQME